MSQALGGYLMAQTATFSVTAAQVETANAVLGTLYVPNDAIIHDVIVQTEDLDDGAAGLIDVGDSAGPATADDDRFVAGFSIQAAGSHRASASGNLLEDDVFVYVNDDAQVEQGIEVTVNTVSATGAAGDITVTVIWASP
jgi:hypothetical protein